MKTWTQLKLQAQDEIQNYESSTLDWIKRTLNDSAKVIGSIHKGTWRWNEDTWTIPSVANQAEYEVPNWFRKVVTMYAKVYTPTPPPGVIYRPKPMFDPNLFEMALQARLGASDVCRFAYIQGTKVTLIPTPQTSGNDLVFRGRLLIADLSRDDYTTGTVTTLVNGSTTVVFTGATLNSSMNYDWIQFQADTDSDSGDNRWYQIKSVTNATTLELFKPYQGTTITQAIPFVIGQTYPIPEQYQMAVIYRTTALWWTKQKDPNMAKTYWMLYDGGNELGLTEEYGGIIGQMFEEEGETFEGPYISPDDNFRFDPNNPQPVATSGSFV